MFLDANHVGPRVLDANGALRHVFRAADSSIGNRHSEEEILDLTQRAGFVDLHALDNKSRRALAI